MHGSIISLSHTYGCSLAKSRPRQRPERSLILNKKLSPHPFLKKINGREFGTTLAKRRDSTETKPANQEGIRLRVSNTILARSVVAVLGLGFIDAGYSGDWSRIGVISKESEDLLKVAAFLVVPLCLILIFSISKQDKKLG